MTESPLHFELPENLSAKKLLSKLGKKLDLEIVEHHYAIKTYYDSFDWRLYNNDIICEQIQSQTSSKLSLINKNTGEVIASEEIDEVPSFSTQFQPGRLRKNLEPPLEMRALLPLCKLPYEIYRINVLNSDKKTVLRISIDENELLSHHVHLHPLKGYEKQLKNVVQILQKPLELKTTECSILKKALQLQGRKPKDYSSKVTLKLKPDMPANKASKIIYQHLLQAIQVNEAGTIADTDSEFLHDFRVAVRRTRAGLSQIKNTLPAPVIAEYSAFFAWLGQITGLTRDMDVYLLSYPQYKAALPVSLREDLTPLYDFLKQKQVLAQKELVNKLDSPKYRKQLVAWEQYLKQTPLKKGDGSHSEQSIKELADQRIWKVYKRILKEGEAINDGSPAEALHDLRKTCKKLRYLMEFFQSLYPADDIKILLKALKNFQSVLGDFQDYEVQELKIKQFSEEMMDKKFPSNTFLAMGVLVQYLDSMRCDARNDFAAQFDIFEQANNQAAFKCLFANKVK